MTKIKITQVKSGIDRPERQKKTLRALGLNKMNASREVEATAQILGMVRTVNHLLKIEEADGGSIATEPVANEEVKAVDPELLETTTAPVQNTEVEEPGAPAPEASAVEVPAT